MYKSFTCLVKYIPRNCILFDAIVNGTFPLISLSDNLFLVCRNGIDFSLLILYLETLLNSFFRKSLGFFFF